MSLMTRQKSPQNIKRRLHWTKAKDMAPMTFHLMTWTLIWVSKAIGKVAMHWPVVHHGVAPRPAPLPLEDAKELDKLLCKVDEAMRAMAKMSVDAERVTVALPQNALGKRQRETIEEHWNMCKDKEATLRHIAVHNELPGHTAKITATALSGIVKEFHEDFTGLKQAVAMAQPLLKQASAAK